MKPPAIASILIVLACMTGCSHGYKAVGTIEDLDRLLQGEVDLENAGGGHFVLRTPDDDLICEGVAHPPTSPSATPGCGDQSGGGILRCTDGRTMTLSWKAINCRAFEGTGIAPDGKRLRFSVRKASF